MTNPAQPAWPQKTREIQSHHLDSTVWNDFTFRDDDIIIASYAKSGTTWLQQIISQLIFNGAEGLQLDSLSPWLDLRLPSKAVKLAALESQTHRRFIKTHLPVDALVFSPQAKYIYIGRDGRDIVWSLHHHHQCANQTWYDGLNNTPGLVGPPIAKPVDSIQQYFSDWLEMDGFPFWSFWQNVSSWWHIRTLPNVLLLHFADLKKDLPDQIQRIAKFLDIAIDKNQHCKIVDHCRFDYMKRNASLCAPMGGVVWQGGAKTFIHKGTNGRWRTILSPQQNKRYQELVLDNLGEPCAHWLASGAGQVSED